MELVKLDNRKPKKVESIAELETPARDVLAWIAEHNGHVRGQYDTGYAFSHSQLEAENPLAFFAVAKEWTLEGAPANMPKDQLFKSPIIVNPRIVSTPEITTKVIEVTHPVTKKVMHETREIKNAIRIKEGCMSFPFKTAKNVDRFYEVEVEYQVPATILGIKRLKKVRETVKGLKAHIFQHECDHMEGRNIYYGNRAR